ncbi:Phosphoglycerate dehydrogenase [Lutibacter oricola]|uniref:Phosphoglycerate dehydrogenase n=1 Tax=Lutibacter oricola TaxID=762486 RepID=A0A1H2RPX0_9FLAO|nr:D-2-hydroxyacid dehydrogenase family protein [Lutibacter oricola]SDW21387.1 Phosphoglycerate dehydrogenase [Lutibacter oricola]
MLKVLHIDTNHQVLKDGLEKLGCICSEDYTSSKTEIEQKISKYNGIVIRSRFKIDKQFINAAKNLKFIARVGAGLESIDVEYAAEKGIHLISAPEGNRNAVSEQALGMILSLFNNIKKADLEIRSGKWLREANRGVELEGKTVGLIGYGNMGKAFAKKLRGFDVEVICYDIKDGVGDENCTQVSLEELQEKTDVLSLHTPFNKLSHEMVNEDFINKFSKPFYLINTARGSAVVTNHLVNALISKKVLGACLDVLEYEKGSFENLFENETLPKAFDYLIKADNVLLSPHVAGWTVESKVRLAQTIVDKVETIFYSEGKELQQKELKKVTGIGGLFFKTKDPKAIKEWYKNHLGFNVDDWGCTFWWKDKKGNEASTQWSPFKSDTDYFNPSKKDYMFNYRVDNLEALLEKLNNEGVTIVGEIQKYEYGKFGWILDLEGNKIELWEPIDAAFK